MLALRRAARVDRNHREIVNALRGVGATVQSLAPIGKGCPDLLVAHDGVNYLLEVKSGPTEPLTEDERAWLDGWGGQVAVVRSVAGALAVVGVTVLGR